MLCVVLHLFRVSYFVIVFCFCCVCLCVFVCVSVSCLIVVCDVCLRRLSLLLFIAVYVFVVCVRLFLLFCVLCYSLLSASFLYSIFEGPTKNKRQTEKRTTRMNEES